MTFKRSTTPQPTTQELQDLDTLKALINQALSDGKITRQELHEIHAFILADGKISDEEAVMMSSMIMAKVKTGEIIME
jgi:uncharacterized membrane protein YebE (DUF533 family)